MYFMNDIFTKTYLNIITELIEAGRQFNSDFPKLNDLKFYKIRFSTHAAKNDAERDVTKGNSKWLYNLIEEDVTLTVPLSEEAVIEDLRYMSSEMAKMTKKYDVNAPNVVVVLPGNRLIINDLFIVQ